MQKWLLISCLLILSACTEHAVDINEDYKTRLNTVLGAAPDKPVLNNIQVPAVPQLESQFQISILELGSLGHCKLSNIVAKRNNQLGKTQVASERLKYQIQFIKFAKECLNDSLTKDEALNDTLKSAVLEKQHNLMSEFNYMLFNETELKGLLQLTSDFLPADSNQYSSASALEAIDNLVNIRQQIANQETDSIDASSITTSLEKLYQNRFIRQLLSSAHLQIAYNQQSTAWISGFDYMNSVCREGKSKKDAQILSTIFNKYYLNKIQGYQADLTGLLEITSPMLFELWRSYPELSEIVDVESKNSLLNQLKQTSREHVIWWQNFYKMCKIKPL
ncbi:hypothetical protein CWB73_14835 [Pseudoalteromonas phenolica]|uniref:DUF3080 domain-containing protein n=1 Tax=Pseudoalteromonas phenolica TaxID=161398 RepID=A0A5S3YR40_9GAMM|nr:DUF3080 family protein [Pseudoalteromonas phenolica]TMP79061.1 hypothetical protein CWB73_14835 [Pseudoalteromonas phenolica]